MDQGYRINNNARARVDEKVNARSKAADAGGEEDYWLWELGK